MVNPYLIIGALVFLAIFGAGSYSAGSRHATNAAKAAQLEAVQKAQAEGHAQAVQDMQMEAEQQEQRTKTQIEYRDRIVKIREESNANPSNCSITDSQRVSINAAISAANGALGSDSGKLPATKPASKQ